MKRSHVILNTQYSEESILAQNYVAKKYLSKLYDDTSMDRGNLCLIRSKVQAIISYKTYEELNIDLAIPIIPRPNHGVAHNSRVVNNVKHVNSFYKNNSQYLHDRLKEELASFPENEIIKLEIAAAFFVACRGSEAGFSPNTVDKYGKVVLSPYFTYRKNSAAAFVKYIKSRQDLIDLFGSDLEQYQNILEDPYISQKTISACDTSDKNYSNIVAKKMIICAAHALDLSRCFGAKKMGVSPAHDALGASGKFLELLLPFYKEHYLKLSNDLTSLFQLAENQIKFTGEKLACQLKEDGFIKNARKRYIKLFSVCEFSTVIAQYACNLAQKHMDDMLPDETLEQWGNFILQDTLNKPETVEQVALAFEAYRKKISIEKSNCVLEDVHMVSDYVLDGAPCVTMDVVSTEGGDLFYSALIKENVGSVLYEMMIEAMNVAGVLPEQREILFKEINRVSKHQLGSVMETLNGFSSCGYFFQENTELYMEAFKRFPDSVELKKLIKHLHGEKIEKQNIVNILIRFIKEGAIKNYSVLRFKNSTAWLKTVGITLHDTNKIYLAAIGREVKEIKKIVVNLFGKLYLNYLKDEELCLFIIENYRCRIYWKSVIVNLINNNDKTPSENLFKKILSKKNIRLHSFQEDYVDTLSKMSFDFSDRDLIGRFSKFNSKEEFDFYMKLLSKYKLNYKSNRSECLSLAFHVVIKGIDNIKDIESRIYILIANIDIDLLLMFIEHKDDDALNNAIKFIKKHNFSYQDYKSLFVVLIKTSHKKYDLEKIYSETSDLDDKPKILERLLTYYSFISEKDSSLEDHLLHNTIRKLNKHVYVGGYIEDENNSDEKLKDLMVDAHALACRLHGIEGYSKRIKAVIESLINITGGSNSLDFIEVFSFLLERSRSSINAFNLAYALNAISVTYAANKEQYKKAFFRHYSIFSDEDIENIIEKNNIIKGVVGKCLNDELLHIVLSSNKKLSSIKSTVKKLKECGVDLYQKEMLACEAFSQDYGFLPNFFHYDYPILKQQICPNEYLYLFWLFSKEQDKRKEVVSSFSYLVKINIISPKSIILNKLFSIRSCYLKNVIFSLHDLSFVGASFNDMVLIMEKILLGDIEEKCEIINILANHFEAGYSDYQYLYLALLDAFDSNVALTRMKLLKLSGVTIENNIFDKIIFYKHDNATIEYLLESKCNYSCYKELYDTIFLVLNDIYYTAKLLAMVNISFSKKSISEHCRKIVEESKSILRGPLVKSDETIIMESLLKEIADSDISLIHMKFDDSFGYVVEVQGGLKVYLNEMVNHVDFSSISIPEVYINELGKKIIELSHDAKDKAAELSGLDYIDDLSLAEKLAVGLYNSYLYLNINRLFRGLKFVDDPRYSWLNPPSGKNSLLVNFITSCLVNIAATNLLKISGQKKFTNTFALRGESVEGIRNAGIDMVTQRLARTILTKSVLSISTAKNGSPFFNSSEHLITKFEVAYDRPLVNKYEGEQLLPHGTMLLYAISNRESRRTDSKVTRMVAKEVASPEFLDKYSYQDTCYLIDAYSLYLSMADDDSEKKKFHSLAAAYRLQQYVDLVVHYFSQYGTLNYRLHSQELFYNDMGLTTLKLCVVITYFSCLLEESNSSMAMSDEPGSTRMAYILQYMLQLNIDSRFNFCDFSIVYALFDPQSSKLELDHINFYLQILNIILSLEKLSDPDYFNAVRQDLKSFVRQDPDEQDDFRKILEFAVKLNFVHGISLGVEIKEDGSIYAKGTGVSKNIYTPESMTYFLGMLRDNAHLVSYPKLLCSSIEHNASFTSQPLSTMEIDNNKRLCGDVQEGANKRAKMSDRL